MEQRWLKTVHLRYRSILRSGSVFFQNLNAANYLIIPRCCRCNVIVIGALIRHPTNSFIILTTRFACTDSLAL